MIEVPLTRGMVAIIDEDDLWLVAPLKWHIIFPGPCSQYAVAHIKNNEGHRTRIYMHRLILGISIPSIQVDHRDGNGLNNTRTNLRRCNNAENSRNKGKYANNTSGYKGVTFDRANNRWRAQIVCNGINKYLGLYATPELASAARIAAAQMLHGEFANHGI